MSRLIELARHLITNSRKFALFRNLSCPLSYNSNEGHSGQSDFEVPSLPELPKNFKIGLIVGPSGSGKTSILSRHFGYKPGHRWYVEGRKVRSYFEGAEQVQRLQVWLVLLTI